MSVYIRMYVYIFIHLYIYVYTVNCTVKTSQFCIHTVAINA